MKIATLLPGCIVALPRERDHATSTPNHATNTATTNVTTDLKTLAEKVLQRNSSRNHAATEQLQRVADDATTLSGDAATIFHDFSLSDLEKMAFTDWEWIKADRTTLEAFAYACASLADLKAGKPPKHYTSTTCCKNCGEVPIPNGLENNGYVLGCMWC